MEEAWPPMAKQEIAAPADLERRVSAYLKAHPASSWDEAVAVAAHLEGAGAP